MMSFIGSRGDSFQSGIYADYRSKTLCICHNVKGALRRTGKQYTCINSVQSRLSHVTVLADAEDTE